MIDLLSPQRRLRSVCGLAASLALVACSPLASTAQTATATEGATLAVLGKLVAAHAADEGLPGELQRVSGLPVTRWRVLQPRLVAIEFACDSAAHCDEGLRRLQSAGHLFEFVSRDGRPQAPRVPPSRQVSP
jgi:hypothetical protein